MIAPLPVEIQVVTNLFVLKMNVIGIGKFVPTDQDRMIEFLFKHKLKPCQLLLFSKDMFLRKE